MGVGTQECVGTKVPSPYLHRAMAAFRSARGAFYFGSYTQWWPGEPQPWAGEELPGF